MHGCALSKAEVEAGDSVLLRCYFEVTRPVTESFSVFVHLMDAQGRHVLSADHLPCAGLFRVPQWRPGHIVEDVAPVSVPESSAGKRLRLYIGLFRGSVRVHAGPADKVDNQNRVPGPTLQVVP